MRKVSPAIDSPSAIRSFSLPAASCVQQRVDGVGRWPRAERDRERPRPVPVGERCSVDRSVVQGVEQQAQHGRLELRHVADGDEDLVGAHGG